MRRRPASVLRVPPHLGQESADPERVGIHVRPVTTDGPLPETSDLVAGWYMIDVESHERAVELAAYVSSEPGPRGEPLYEWIDVREVG